MVDIVSKNGNLLLNVGPKADGTISQEDQDILLAIGGWLETNGEAIYDTSYWRTYGEGPTKVVEGQFTDGKSKIFTPQDIRFTVKGSCLYATVLVYPEDGEVKITSLKEKSHDFQGIIQQIEVLGFEEQPVWKRTAEALVVKTNKVRSPYPVVLKFTVD